MTSSAQQACSVSSLVDGGFIVTWQSNNQDSSGWGIYAQRYSANGGAIGSEFRVNTSVNSDQVAPSVTGLADGGFLVAWQSNGQDGSGDGIYAQRYASSGDLMGSEFKVNTYTALGQVSPSVTSLSDGGFLVAWQSDGQDGSGWGVYAQRYAADGSKIGGASWSALTGPDNITGTPSNDFISSISTDDVIRGDMGDDTFSYTSTDFILIDGGSGQDTLRLHTDPYAHFVISLDLTTLDDAKLTNLEIIDLSYANLKLSASDVLAITDSSNTLKITGTQGLVMIDSGWSAGIISNGFETYTKDGAIILVQEELNGSFPNHAPTGAVTISGTAIPGQILGADTSKLSDSDGWGAGYNYTWKDQTGAVLGTDYLLAIETDTLGKQIALTVNFTDGLGNYEAVTSSSVTSAVSAGYYSEFQVFQGDFLSSTYTPTSVTNLTDGGFLIAWSSEGRADDSNHGIYAQRYAANGTASGSTFLANSYTNSDQRDPSVTSLNDGGFLITWQSAIQDDFSYGIYGQRYTQDGATMGTEFKINTTKASTQWQPSVTNLIDGGFLVAWTSNQDDLGNYGIYAQRYQADGIALGQEFHVNTHTADAQTNPQVTSLVDGGYVITWQSKLQDGSDFGIYAQRYTANGTASGREFRVNSYTSGAQSDPSITSLADGGFLISWESSINHAIYAQRYASDGAVSGSEFIVAQGIDPSVTSLADGGFLVTWTALSQGYGSIQAQRYAADGKASGYPIEVHPYPFGISYQQFPSVTSLDDGSYLISWSQNDNGYQAIYAQRYAEDGSKISDATWTALIGSDNINGTNSSDLITAISTGDKVLGNGGNDSFAFTSTDFALIDGGRGQDTLTLSVDLNLTTLDDAKLSNLEFMDLGSKVINLTLSASDVLAITDGADTLKVTGSSGTVDIEDGWSFGGTANGFETYTKDGATLLVQQELNVV